MLIIQRFLRPRQQNASSPEINDTSTLPTSLDGSIDDITRVNELIKSFPLPESTESTLIPLVTPTPTTRKSGSLVWIYIVIGHPITRISDNTRVWRYQLY